MPVMLLDFAISAFVTVFVVVDPIAMAPTFLAVTDGMPKDARKSVALRASVIAGIILTGTALVGERLLVLFGISLPAFRIAGGLLLFWIAAEMVFGVRSRHEGEAAEQAMEERVRNVAAFPLAIPLLAGPGAIAATVLLAGRAGGDWRLFRAGGAVGVRDAASCLLTFRLAERISGFLGVTGNIVLSRLLGVLLAALAVPYVVGGICGGIRGVK